jgi:hypothetical protein
MIISPHPAPMRGAYRDRHGRRRGLRWTRGRRKTGAVHAYGEIVWSRSPDAGIKSCGTFRKATVARKPGAPRRARISRNTIAQGMPGCLGCPVVACVRKSAISWHARLAGAVSIRHSLRPPLMRVCTFRKIRAFQAAAAKTHALTYSLRQRAILQPQACASNRFGAARDLRVHAMGEFNRSIAKSDRRALVRPAAGCINGGRYHLPIDSNDRFCPNSSSLRGKRRPSRALRTLGPGQLQFTSRCTTACGQ